MSGLKVCFSQFAPTTSYGMRMASEASRRIDRYLDKVPEPFRELLRHVREVVRRVAPDAEEIITYSMPGIGQNGPVVS